MAITPLNLARVSYNLRVHNLRESMRLNQMGMYHTQNQLTTGLRFLQPSEDPLRAASAADLDRRLERLEQVGTNLRSVESVLTEVESAAQEAMDLFEEARTLAVQVISDGTTQDEREALVTVVDSLLSQLVTVGNRRYLNTYLFSGHQNQAPFAMGYGGVFYSGDANRMETIVENDLSTDSFTIPGMEFFAAVSSKVRGAIDLDPALTADTRISALGGATGRGVQLGRIVVTADDEQVQIDLSSAATVGDVIDRLNADLPEGLTAEMDLRGITIRQDGAREITMADVGGGRTAVDLGLSGTFDGGERAGPDLQPHVTALTRITDLAAGAGVDLTESFVIRNGGQTATITLNRAETVEDVLNAINLAGIGVWARIACDGSSLEVLSRVSGTDLSIEESGGSSATALGLRSMHAGTALADLNDDAGVRTVGGNDVRITTANGTTIDVDLDGVTTLQGVLDRLNAAGAGSITAGLVAQGNGLLITDLTAGAGTLRAESLNDSPAVRDLGLDVTVTGKQLVGRDVHPVRADSPFTALLELRAGMESDDRLTMMRAGTRIERVLEEMQRVQGQMASQARMMGERTERVETETTATRVLLSDIREVDFTDATIRFQQLQTALQANLTTASKVLNLSLLDYLR